jgi:hypothetical protein
LTVPTLSGVAGLFAQYEIATTILVFDAAADDVVRTWLIVPDVIPDLSAAIDPRLASNATAI